MKPSINCFVKEKNILYCVPSIGHSIGFSGFFSASAVCVEFSSHSINHAHVNSSAISSVNLTIQQISSSGYSEKTPCMLQQYKSTCGVKLNTADHMICQIVEEQNFSESTHTAHCTLHRPRVRDGKASCIILNT